MVKKNIAPRAIKYTIELRQIQMIEGQSGFQKKLIIIMRNISKYYLKSNHG